MKKNKFKGIVAGITVLSAALCAVSCSKKGSSSIKPKETITLDVYSQLANYSGLQTGWFADLMLEKFNVKLNIIPETGGAYQTRMESGNLGDIVVWGNDGDQYQKAVNAGLLLDWEEDDLLAKHGSYINENMKLALQKNKMIASPDKKIHGFGHAVSTSASDVQQFFYTWDLRFDLYEQIGKPAIKNLDDMVDVLAKMKEICPKDDNGNTTYGISMFNDWDGDMVMFVKALATAYYGYDEFYVGLYDPATGTFHGAVEENGPYLECLKFYNKLFQKGLLDPDSLTQKYNGMSEDYQHGTAFFNIFNWMASQTYNSETHTSAGKAMYPVCPEEASPIVYGQNVYGAERIWSIGSKTAYPELCMEIINYFCTPEGFLTTQYGPQGVTWEIKNGKTYLTEFGKKAMSDQNNTEMPSPYKGTFHDGAFQINNITWCLDASNPLTEGETYNRFFWASEQVPASNPVEANWREWAGASNADEYLLKHKHQIAPGTLYTATPIPTDLELKKSQVCDAIKNGSWNAIYAKDDAEYEKIVSKMLSDVKAYGWDELNEFFVAQAKVRAAAENAVKK